MDTVPRRIGSPLCEAIFTCYGGPTTRDDDRDRLSSFLQTLSEGGASLNWDLKVFDIRQTFLCGPYRPWTAIREIQDVRSAGNEVPHSLVEAVCSTWAFLKSDLRSKLHSGDLMMVGRPSPRAAFEFITSDAWPHYEVEDWESGQAASADGDRIFSIHIGVPSEISLHEADRSLSSPQKEQSGFNPRPRKSAPKANSVSRALEALFPNPSEMAYMTVKERNKKVRHWLANNNKPDMSEQTIKRAWKKHQAAPSRVDQTTSDK